MFLKPIGAGACFLLFSMVSGAQTIDTLGSTIPEIPVVSEKRFFGEGLALHGRNVEVLYARDLRALPVQTLTEALGYISGIDIRQRGPVGAQADITMLGGTFEQVLILVDGIPMRDPQTGHHQMNLPVDLNMVERIEIIKGSAARIYGANAMLGAINIITKSPDKEKINVQLYSASPFASDTASGDLYYAAGARVALGFGTQRSAHRFDLGYQKTNGYRYNSGSEQQRINYLGKIQFTDHSGLQIMAGGLINEFGANQFYSPRVDHNSVEKVSTANGALRFYHYQNGWRIAPLAYWRYNHDDYNLNAFNYRNNHFTTTAGAELHISQKREKFSFGGGLEFRTEIIRSNNLGAHERFYHAGYIETKRAFRNTAQITVGANIQYNTDFGWNVYPGLEFNTPVIEQIRFFFNAGSSNRMPTYTDLYYSDASTTGNALLKPESAISAEAGLRRQLGKTRLQASAFIRETVGLIDYIQSTDLVFGAENLDPVVVRGAEFSGLQEIKPAQDVLIFPSAVRVTYTWLDADLSIRDEKSRYALEHLRHQLNVQLHVRMGKAFTHTFALRLLERFAGPQYTVADYRLKFTSENWSIFGDISNAFDQKYVEAGWVPMPGKWFRIGAELLINR